MIKKIVMSLTLSVVLSSTLYGVQSVNVNLNSSYKATQIPKKNDSSREKTTFS